MLLCVLFLLKQKHILIETELQLKMATFLYDRHQ